MHLRLLEAASYTRLSDTLYLAMRRQPCCSATPTRLGRNDRLVTVDVTSFLYTK